MLVKNKNRKAGNDVAYQNKDILFKVLSENFENKSFEALGLELPKIKKVLPTSLPKITAKELRADGLFLLEGDGEGDIALILDYESKVKSENFIKYLDYALAVLKTYFKSEKIKDIIIAVIYTGDIKSAPNELSFESLKISIRQIFLSEFDTDELYFELKRKVSAGERLTDEEVIRFIVLPLTEPRKDGKQELIERSVSLAKEISDEEQQLFVIAGMLVATDKFIDKEYLKKVKEWISMTKIARLYEKEKKEAVKEAVKERETALARKMLSNDISIPKVIDCTGFSEEEVLKIQAEMR
jgi:predicted transposase/invertase (TIGR01784 family)